MNQNLKKYFEENINNYSIETLKSEALKAGNNEEEINQISILFNKNEKMFLFYFLPIFFLVFFTILFLYLKLYYGAFTLFLSIIIIIISTFSIIQLIKKKISKNTFFIYTSVSILLIPFLLSFFVIILNHLDSYYSLKNINIIAPEITIFLTQLNYYMLIYFSVLNFVLGYKFFFNELLKGKSKLILLLASFLLFLFTLKISITFYAIFKVILYSLFADLMMMLF